MSLLKLGTPSSMVVITIDMTAYGSRRFVDFYSDDMAENFGSLLLHPEQFCTRV